MKFDKIFELVKAYTNMSSVLLFELFFFVLVNSWTFFARFFLRCWLFNFLFTIFLFINKKEFWWILVHFTLGSFQIDFTISVRFLVFLTCSICLKVKNSTFNFSILLNKPSWVWFFERLINRFSTNVIPETERKLLFNSSYTVLVKKDCCTFIFIGNSTCVYFLFLFTLRS